MSHVLRYPLAVFVLSFAVLFVATRIGMHVHALSKHLHEELREDFGVVLGATLTLLALIIGFSFSMAVARYDQRKTYEEAEANAIGTEYLRADLLPAADAAKVRPLLRSYLDRRIEFYLVRDTRDLDAINSRTAQLQNELWASVRSVATAQPTPVNALVVAGMNDVLNSQGYTQAAYWNRIPPGVWLLMGIIAIAGNALVGFGSRGARGAKPLLLVLPMVISLAFFLIADIDSPHTGLVHVSAQNLVSLAGSLRAP